jgi:purine nucleosidase
MSEARPLFLDVDTGVDDALAVLLAARSTSLQVVGVTAVSGNTSSAQATRNTRFLLEEFGEDANVRVIAGATHALDGREPQIDSTIHGIDGLGGVYAAQARSAEPRDPPDAPAADRAVDFLLEAAARHGDGLTLVATGPLTHLALAAQRDPTVLSSVGRILAMGGALDVSGNVTPVAEFNTYCDPEAYEVLLGAGIAIDLFPLDVTRKVCLLRSALTEKLGLPAGELKLIREMTAGYMDFHQRRSGLDGAYIHDALPVAAAAGWDGFRYRHAAVAVDTSPTAERGRTVWSSSTDRAPWRVAVDLDPEAFLAWYWRQVVS